MVGHRSAHRVQCINARAETVATKPAFRDAFRERRCLIIVDGWYEWATRAGRRKQPYAIRMPDGAPFAFAGLWDSWRPSEGADPIETCTIVTTVTCSATAHRHHRMPVMLSPEMYPAWLDPYARRDELQAMLKPYDGALDVFPVPALVNAGKVDDERCLERIAVTDDEPAPATRHGIDTDAEQRRASSPCRPSLRSPRRIASWGTLCGARGAHGSMPQDQ